MARKLWRVVVMVSDDGKADDGQQKFLTKNEIVEDLLRGTGTAGLIFTVADVREMSI